MSRLDISFDELKNELDKLRFHVPPRIWTDEQIQCLKYARKNKPPVSWAKLCNFWKSKGWGAIAGKTLICKYKEVKDQEGN